jgi:hypothetical protein
MKNAPSTQAFDFPQPIQDAHCTTLHGDTYLAIPLYCVFAVGGTVAILETVEALCYLEFRMPK